MAVEYIGFLVKLWQFCFNSFANDYSPVFEVAEYEYEVRTLKFKTETNIAVKNMILVKHR